MKAMNATVGQRLFFGLLPSLLAVLLVAGLAYYGQYARTAPGIVVGGAAILAIVSLALTWANTKYLASRITRLAGPPRASGLSTAVDELDRIEQTVDRLGSALAESESERARAERAATTRLHEQSTMLAATARTTIAQLDEVRLPLHILLDARFGDLNENQEELLGTARDASDALDVALRRLAQVADVNRGALTVQRESTQVNDVVRAVLPLARAAAERHGARVESTLEPGLPRVLADRVRLAEALALLVDAAGESSSATQPLVIATSRRAQHVVIDLAPLLDGTPSLVLPRRLVDVQGGHVEHTGTCLTIRLG